MMHFAYGSNMHHGLMRKHAPDAQPLGIAALADHRFVITADGYASVAPDAGHDVHGLLWRITPRDRVTLDAWESIDAGLYRAETLPVRRADSPAQHVPALVYIARERTPGKARAGYMEIVIEAARALDFPSAYITALEQWLPQDAAEGASAGQPKFGDFR
jgi:AIG2-like family